eukprot:3027265-Alexandrium_andersonii.AAC.1
MLPTPPPRRLRRLRGPGRYRVRLVQRELLRPAARRRAGSRRSTSTPSWARRIGLSAYCSTTSTRGGPGMTLPRANREN